MGVYYLAGMMLNSPLPLDSAQKERVLAAIRLIDRTPRYQEVALDLRRLLTRGDIRFSEDIADRAHAGVTGNIYLGAEALEGDVLSLAETLIHEHYHARRQNPFEKTASFWLGVVTRAPVMRRYERPAYSEAAAFLTAVAGAFPDLADAALRERDAVARTFAAEYGTSLVIEQAGA